MYKYLLCKCASHNVKLCNGMYNDTACELAIDTCCILWAERTGGQSLTRWHHSLPRAQLWKGYWKGNYSCSSRFQCLVPHPRGKTALSTTSTTAELGYIQCSEIYNLVNKPSSQLWSPDMRWYWRQWRQCGRFDGNLIARKITLALSCIALYTKSTSLVPFPYFFASLFRSFNSSRFNIWQNERRWKTFAKRIGRHCWFSGYLVAGPRILLPEMTRLLCLQPKDTKHEMQRTVLFELSVFGQGRTKRRTAHDIKHENQQIFYKIPIKLSSLALSQSIN